MSRWVSMADGYPKGSVIVCPDCFRPVYALERGISLGDKGGRAASAFRPLTRADIQALVDRQDIHPRQRDFWRTWMVTPDCQRVINAPRIRSGDPCLCPNCGGQWVKTTEREYGTSQDRAYELELLHIPPLGKSQWFKRPRWRDETLPDLEVVERN